MISSVESYLQHYSIEDKRIIVGLSGGPDSVALITILQFLKSKYRLSIEAAYINHGIRSLSENNEDYKLVKKLCESLSIKLNNLIVPPNEIKNVSIRTNSSVEAVARDYRYTYFNSLIESDGLIAVGHNNDDQIETQVMRFFQGSSIEGLLGIKGRRDNIIRPLIELSKLDILKYLDKNCINYNIDKTNNQLDYLRNSVRHKLIPNINNIFPSYKKALKNIEAELKTYKQIVDNIYPSLNWVVQDGFMLVDYNEFMELPELKRREEIYNCFDLSFKGDQSSFRLPKRFLAPLSKNRFRNGEIVLEGYGHNLFRKNEKLIWGHILDINYLFKFYIQEEGPYGNSRLKIKSSNTGGAIFISGLEYPYILRSYLDGYPEVKIIKKLKITYLDYNQLFIVEKNNHVYAIIHKDNIIYMKHSVVRGLYIDLI